MWLCEKPLLRLEVPCREEGRGERREQEMWGGGEGSRGEMKRRGEDMRRG